MKIKSWLCGSRKSKAFSKHALEKTIIHVENPLSKYVIKSLYKSHRTEAVNENEWLNWTVALVQLLAVQRNISLQLKTAIRRGVPDLLKSTLLLKIHHASHLMESEPELYNMALKNTFGKHVPKHIKGRTPTFASGFLGLEESIVGKINVSHLETDIETQLSEISWVHLDPIEDNVKPEKSFRSLDKFTLSRLKSDLSPKLWNLRNNPNNSGKIEIEHSAHSCTHFLYFPKYDPFEFESYSEYGRHPSKFTPTLTDRYPQKNHDRYKDSELFPSVKQNLVKNTKSEAKADKSTHSGGFHPFLYLKQFVSTQSMQSFNYTTSKDGFIKKMETVSLEDKDINTFEAVTHLHLLLTSEGVNAAKRLLWCCSVQFPQIEFCAVLPSSICILLLYLSEKQAFYFLHSFFQKIKEAEKNDPENVFFIYLRSDFIRFVTNISAIAQKCLGRLTNHLRTLKFDLSAWFAFHLANGLIQLVPLDLLLRIHITSFMEGVWTFQRYILAVLIKLEKLLLKCDRKEEIESLLTLKNLKDPDELNAVTKLAFSLSLKYTKSSIRHISSSKLPTPYLTGVRIYPCYRPCINDVSEIIDNLHWEYLWIWLPQKIKILDPKLCWSSYKDGCSLSAVNRKTSAAYELPMVFFIETVCDVIFGCFLQRHLSFEHPHMSDCNFSDTFIFTMKPQFANYDWQSKTHQTIHFTKEHLILGSNQPAIWIDSDVKCGVSLQSQSFNSPSLVKNQHGDFTIRSMEIWSLC